MLPLTMSIHDNTFLQQDQNFVSRPYLQVRGSILSSLSLAMQVALTSLLLEPLQRIFRSPPSDTSQSASVYVRRASEQLMKAFVLETGNAKQDCDMCAGERSAAFANMGTKKEKEITKAVRFNMCSPELNIEPAYKHR